MIARWRRHERAVANTTAFLAVVLGLAAALAWGWLR